MDQISASNASMLKHIADVSGHTMLLKGQLQECELRWNRATADNVRLHQQVSLLSTKLEVSHRFVCYMHAVCSSHACCSSNNAAHAALATTASDKSSNCLFVSWDCCISSRPCSATAAQCTWTVCTVLARLSLPHVQFASLLYASDDPRCSYRRCGSF